MIKNKYIKSLGLCLLTLSMLVGCNDTKENESTDTNAKKVIKIDKVASAENFKRVINNLIVDECIYIDTNAFPAEIDMNEKYLSSADKYKTFEKLGFIKSDGKIEEKITKFRTKVKTKYILTDKGNKHYKTDLGILKKSPGFCVATQEVGEITNFTAPKKDMMGQTVSKVKYTIKTTEEAFVKDINKSIFVGSRVFKYKKSDSTNLILTEMKGWMSLYEFRQNN